MRLVLIPAGEATDWLLPPAEERNLTWIPGGHRTLYEMAVAAAAGGHDVEVRGTYERTLHEIARAGEGQLRFPSDRRAPDADDLILVPEGGVGTILLTRVLLSPARVVMAVLAPPGLFGPRILPGFRPRDPLDVDPSDVALSEHFRFLRTIGFELLTNSPGISRRAEAAGEDCTLLATGQPLPLPEPGERTHDAAFLAANRWAPLSRRVAERVRGRVLEIPESSWTDAIRAMASARILILPVVVEGRSSIQIEARAVGTIPVGLRSNVFYDGLEEGGGVLVDSLDHMVEEIHRLLDRPEELAARSRQAVESARRQMDWEPFVERVAAFLSAPAPPDPSGAVRPPIGEALAEVVTEFDGLRRTVDDLRRMVDELQRGVAWQRDVIARTEDERDRLRAEVEGLRREAATARTDRDASHRDADRLRSRRSVRLADGVAGALRALVGRGRGGS